MRDDYAGWRQKARPDPGSTQVQGYKPSATAAKHYKRRPIDLLRMHHEKIAAWILQQAGIKFEPATTARAGLQVDSAA